MAKWHVRYTSRTHKSTRAAGHICSPSGTRLLFENMSKPSTDAPFTARHAAKSSRRFRNQTSTSRLSSALCETWVQEKSRAFTKTSWTSSVVGSREALNQKKSAGTAYGRYFFLGRKDLSVHTCHRAQDEKEKEDAFMSP